MKHEDGSSSKFRRDGRTIERQIFDKPADNAKAPVLRMTIIYRKSNDGKLRSSKIYDSAGKFLYRAAYGYRRDNDNFIAENIYDAVIGADNNKPAINQKPICVVRHRNNAEGKRLEPILVADPARKDIEKLFGKKGFSYIEDPWVKNAVEK